MTEVRKGIREHQIVNGAKEEQSSVVKLDNLFCNFYGNTTAITSNITFDFTGNKLGAVARMLHSSGTAPTIPAEGVVIKGSYSTGELNFIWFCLTRISPSQIVEITISQAQ